MVWIFGYGSLIWKVDFPYERKVVGFVEGYIRRFWWWSEDHRGYPGSPGRVVNLLPSDDPSDRVWGVGYEICDKAWAEKVEAHLDHREKGGYTQRKAVFHPVVDEDKQHPIEVTLYIGETSHRQYAGPAPIEEMAETILTSIGPSGPNIDYLFNLAEAFRELGIKDDHVFELEKAVKKLQEERKKLFMP